MSWAGLFTFIYNEMRRNVLAAHPDHILIVDDDREICRLLSEYLEKNTFRASTVNSGKEMWRCLEQKQVNLIVLDLMLPGEDGLEICRNLRARKSIPVIILSALGEETDRIVGLEMGADDYLTKPFNPRELLVRIKAVLRRSRTLPAAGNDNGRSVQTAFRGMDAGLEQPSPALPARGIGTAQRR